MTLFKRMAALFLCLATLFSSACALTNEERTALFEEALAALRTPAQIGQETGTYTLHTGDSAYAPCVNPGIIPYDQQDEFADPQITGTFTSSDESIVTISPNGLMTGVAPGEATITCSIPEGEFSYSVTVGDEELPEVIKNYLYVLNREFYTVQRKRLPKYNQYAKWYYGKRKEVGWCAVFTIYCANAAGTEPLTLKKVDYANPPMVQFLRQGQVGHHYDGFLDMGRFVSVPKPGYLVIYADMKKGYRTTHIASVTDVQDLGGGRYAITTVEGNMGSSVKSFCFLYDSNKPNHTVGIEKGRKLQNNMEMLPKEFHTDPLVQYELHTDYWSVFGFCQTWE